MTLALTAKELELLVYLMSHPGQAFARAELLEQVWGFAVGDTATVTVHVRRLREKIESDPDFAFLHRRSPRLLPSGILRLYPAIHKNNAACRRRGAERGTVP